MDHRAAHPAQSVRVETGDGRFWIKGAAALLARKDVVRIEVVDDVSYHDRATYHAIPLAHLIDGASARAGMLEAAAADGFVAHLPLSMVRNRDPSLPIAYLAVEDPGSQWRALPGKSVSAGPFYIVWIGPHAQRVPAEYWPYQIVALRVTTAPDDRWSVLNPASVAGASANVRDGRALFVANCLSCHKIDGQGEGTIGPDLNRPMNPTAYFQRAALHRYIRNPASLRHWPAQQMPAFDAARLPDHEIDEIIDYLAAYRSHSRS
ncbi:c-type cytochrome [Sphingomonas morindae]|uniref:Cytochrome c n=1 Tax=Sphingomonas morindae TaxID=1541170 RepID=A0ABY4X9A4_9SPHN|nr:cytochrome c [Sphingomonas morindae]USI73502.1 cytochrome c [Sphingomonas morindae]